MESLWSSTANLPSFPALPGSLKTDVLIIGGGIAGVLCAHELQKRGVDYALIEASEICSGITKCTTAKITAQHGLIYASLFDRLGKEKAALYLRANLQAIEAYEALAQTIDCDFERKDAFVYTQRSPKKIQEEAAALQLLGYPVQIDHELPLPIPILSAIRFASQAQFHPLKFIAGIAAPLHIYEHTQALELTRRGVQTSRGEIQAKKIIVATHFPIYNRHGFYPVKLYQERSYVLALKDAQDVGGMYIDEAKGGLSFRNADGLLLLGGGSHRTGKNTGGWAALESLAAQYYPKASTRFRWATQDCMPLDSVPYIGPYASGLPGVYVATGFQKWGMSTAMLCSHLLVDLVTGRENPYAPVFTPNRSVWYPQLAINAFETLKNLLTPTRPRCPHLGCALKWNPTEHTWDCSCHGSRFDENGALIDNPAQSDLKL